MSMFLTSLEADPETQRFNKATIYLRTLVFGRLSDDHVIALAVLHELGGVYRRAYGTAQVLYDPVQYGAQEEALRAHLRALGLPCSIDELELHELILITTWREQRRVLPRPFDATLGAFLEHTEAHINANTAKHLTLKRQEQVL